MIGVGIDSRLVTHWQIALGVGEPIKARYMGVIGITSASVTLGIGMCEGVSE